MILIERLRNLNCLHEKIESVVMLVKRQTALNKGVVGHVVWLNPVLDHSLVHVDGVLDLACLNARLDHASVDEDSGLYSFEDHVVKYTQ